MIATIKNELGTISISEKVITTLVVESASEAYGLVGLAAQNVKDGIFELLRVDNYSRGVSVRVNGDRVEIDLTVIMEYGVRIAIVADNIIEKVKYNIESNTGLVVESVNVIVQGIRV
ncbi:MAG: Asp23/Gls24 family envelope stress response protein [Tissierellia bacterium]|nr:Asp23/Gls24 family envelope stress response protein [Tissierellia bacterium]